MRILIDIEDQLSMKNNDIYDLNNFPDKDGYYIVYDGVAKFLVAKTSGLINELPLREETLTQTDTRLMTIVERLEEVAETFEDFANTFKKTPIPVTKENVKGVDKNFVIDLVKAVKGNK